MLLNVTTLGVWAYMKNIGGVIIIMLGIEGYLGYLYLVWFIHGDLGLFMVT